MEVVEPVVTDGTGAAPTATTALPSALEPSNAMQCSAKVILPEVVRELDAWPLTSVVDGKLPLQKPAGLEEAVQLVLFTFRSVHFRLVVFPKVTELGAAVRMFEKAGGLVVVDESGAVADPGVET